MKITIENEKTLQIEEQKTCMIVLSIAFFVFFVLRLGYFILHHESSVREYIGVILGIVITCGAGNAFSERTEFQFNRYEKAVKWSKKKIIGSETSGIIPFSDIVDVKLASISLRQDARYRIELVCRNQTIPISAAFVQGDKEKCEQIINRIVECLKPSRTQ